MSTYIALLRGINVSGQKKIKMADLREQLSELGWQNIQTYIQSGNVIFESDDDDLKELGQKLAEKIKEHYGFEVPTMVKRPADFQHVLEHNPFSKELEEIPKQFYVTFLAEAPDKEKVEALRQVDYSPEQWGLVGTDIYFYPPQGYGRAKMHNNFFEKKLKVQATTRNWRTIQVLLEMTQGKN